MKRRAFITLLGGAAVAWPIAAGGQPSKLPTIGVLGPSTAPVAGQWTAALVQRLREFGWIEGRTLAIEYRWARGRADRAAEIAAEFVSLKVDVIVTAGTLNVVAAKQVTSVIPIVFAGAGDPVGTGLVASLARPGGNVTGLSNQSTDLAAKRIELLKRLLPRLAKLAVIARKDGDAVVHAQLEKDITDAGTKLGFTWQAFSPAASEDYDVIFARLAATSRPDEATPVTLAPGLARLATSPDSIGFGVATMTIGIVVVACFSALT